MKGTTKFGLIAALFLAGVASTAPSADEGHGTDHATGGDHRPAIGNSQCPVMPEEAVDPAIYTDYEGRRVYFCCAKCRRQFLENPEPYLDHLSHLATPKALRRFVAYLGKLHPLAVHFPIGVLAAAALAELMAAVRRKDTYGKVGLFCVVVGALAAVVTAAFGWAAGAFAHYTGDLGAVLEYHRWAGTATAALAVGTATLAVVGKPSDSRRGIRAAYRVLLALTVVTMTAAGHLGATLIYGVGHLSW